MPSLTATIPADHQKDGIVKLEIKFDSASDGWYLNGYAEQGGAPSLELWNMSEEDAKELAANDWGVARTLWEKAGESAGAKTVDCNGTELKNGDDITVIKDLDVKGAGQTVKRGTTVKNISLTNDPELIDCRTKEIKGLVLKSCFVKKL